MDEVRNPVKTLRSVSLSALMTATSFYILANVAFFTVVPVEEIKQSGQLIAGLFFECVLGQQVGRIFLSLIVALSAAGNVMVVTFSYVGLPPVFMATIVHEAIWHAAGRSHRSLLPFHACYYPPAYQRCVFVYLGCGSYPEQFFALALSIGAIWLRYKRPNLRRPFRAWIPAMFRICFCLIGLAVPFIPPSERNPDGLWYATYAVVGVGIIGFSILFWLIWTIILPWLGRYRLEEKQDILDDGTRITVLT
ncbi:hypothetical protein GGS21DRAFT_475976 [Xylaria nigripes]|nr:hypothetical protein GGS21DRAFT_475976 [Xylaria nigripes]